MSGNCRQQCRYVKWLSYVSVAAGVEAPLAIVDHRMSGQGDYRRYKARTPQPCRGFEAIHDGHLHVHQHNVERISRLLGRQNKLDRTLSILRHGDLGPGFS